MRKFVLAFVIAALAALSSFNMKAQGLMCGPECLGTLCSIDVNLVTDHKDGLYATYPFPHPEERLGPMQYNNGYPMYSDNPYFYCMGPGRPYVTVEGNEPFLHLDLKNLEIEATVMAQEQGTSFMGYVETVVDVPVQREFIQFDGCRYQCHYHIRLVVNFNKIEY